MNKENRLCLRSSIKRLVDQQPEVTNFELFLAMKKQGFAKSTIYKAIHRIRNGESLMDKPRSGRPRTILSPVKAKIVRAVENKLGKGARAVAKLFEISQRSVVRILEEKNASYRKRKKVPKYTDKQLQDIPTKARRLYRYDLKPDHFVIMDDEKYFTFSSAEDPMNFGFWSRDHQSAPDHIKYKQKEKFPQKVLVWVAISERGISEPFIIRRSSVSMDKENYLKECIQTRLQRFINKFHDDGKYIFWPDLASCHYAKSVLSYMDDNGFNYVAKENNPPNVPQARPIENFWSILSSKVYANGWEAKTVTSLIRRIHFVLRKIELPLIESLMRGVRAKVRCLFEEGPLSTKIIK